jgi:hypothetical protein
LKRYGLSNEQLFKLLKKHSKVSPLDKKTKTKTATYSFKALMADISKIEGLEEMPSTTVRSRINSFNVNLRKAFERGEVKHITKFVTDGRGRSTDWSKFSL